MVNIIRRERAFAERLDARVRAEYVRGCAAAGARAVELRIPPLAPLDDVVAEHLSPERPSAQQPAVDSVIIEREPPAPPTAPDEVLELGEAQTVETDGPGRFPRPSRRPDATPDDIAPPRPRHPTAAEVLSDRLRPQRSWPPAPGGGDEPVPVDPTVASPAPGDDEPVPDPIPSDGEPFRGPTPADVILRPASAEADAGDRPAVGETAGKRDKTVGPDVGRLVGHIVRSGRDEHVSPRDRVSSTNGNHPEEDQ
jgi:hypothetical protein